MAVSYSKISQFTKVPTYTVLQELVGDFLNRSDQGTLDKIPLFINFAEKNIIREFRIPAMEVTKLVNWGNDIGDIGRAEGWMYIPSDYLEMKDMWMEGLGIINRLPFSDILRHDNGGGGTEVSPHNENPSHTEASEGGCGSWGGSDPAHGVRHGDGPMYARSGKRWYIRPRPADSDQIYMTYYQDPSELSEETESSYLLELAPDAILYASVSEGYRFLMEEEKATHYERLSKERIESIERQVEEAEYSGGVIQIHPPA